MQVLVCCIDRLNPQLEADLQGNSVNDATRGNLNGYSPRLRIQSAV
ncbi:hypothetical protein SAMN05216344_101257 [Polaromonas sp. OV174]|nr:hypothetical protein SAMN05216344_101257 [Polaromonas sp. OV174]